MAEISEVRAREILDSRGHPTVEVDVHLTDGKRGRGAVPSGASTGSREAMELRDGDGGRYLGRGVQKAVENVNRIVAPRMRGLDPRDQRGIDNLLLELDGTGNKSRLGANAVVGTSLAVAHAAAADAAMPLFRYLGGTDACTLPIPMMNILNGGAHADNNLDFQEFMAVPIGRDFRDSLRMGSEVFQSLKSLLKKQGLSTAVGDEGGFAPSLGSTQQALELIVQASEAAGLEPGRDVFLAMDAAASEFFKDGRYVLSKSSRETLSSDQMVGLYAGLCEAFPVVSIEDPMSEDDWAGWKAITSELGHQTQLVGDDVFVTNREILARGVREGIANAILVKINQIGTLTETLDTMELAFKSQYGTVVSHRSGETEDTTISDISVATNAGQIKTGAPSRGERTAKYNQLLRIEELLGNKARFPSREIFGGTGRRP